MKMLLEIRPGEGGDDAKLLVEEQASLYLRTALAAGIGVQLIENVPGKLG